MAKTFEFKGPNGKTYEITAPDGATSEQAFAVLQGQLGGSEMLPKRQTSVLQDVGEGAKDLAMGAVSGASTVGRGILAAPKLIGLPPIGGQQWHDDSKKAMDDMMRTGNVSATAEGRDQKTLLGSVGEFAGEMAGTAGIQGPKILAAGAKYLPKALASSKTAAAAVEGAGAGTLLGQGDWKDVGIGAAGGIAGQKILGGAARLISSPVKQTAQAEALRRAGIDVTAGQGSRGTTVVKALEEAAQYLPVAANAVRRQRELPYQQIRDRVAHEVQPPANALDATSPLMKPSGHSMDEILANARQEMGQQYDNVLQGKVFREDPKFAQELADLHISPNHVLSESQRSGLARFINDQLMPGKRVGGWKGEDLSIIRRNFEDAAARQTNPEMGASLREASDKILEMMTRQDPEVGTVFQALSGPYRNLKTAEEAARHSVAQGEFGVAALANAGHNTGNTGMRDFGRLAATALKDDLNRGGTGIRTAIGAAALGAGYGYGGGQGAAGTAVLPAALALALGTRTGQRVMSGQLKKQRQLADFLRTHPDAGALTGANAAVNTFGGQ